MITARNINIRQLTKWSGKYFLILMIFNGGVAICYFFGLFQMHIPWLPVSVMGTAVAFYTGFKNNNAYDRLWEARKIWGGIVNDSRTWGMMVDGYVNNLFTKQDIAEGEIQRIKRRLIYRHIAWLYVHRSQLLIPTSWEHLSQKGRLRRKAEMIKKKYGTGLLDDDITHKALIAFLPVEEYDRLLNYANTATQIINEQSRDLTQLRSRDLIDDFRHVELANVLKSFYALQGKNERIKKFPLPRQYASVSQYFVVIFIFLLPFSMVPELMSVASWGIWVSIPVTALIGWIYIMMEIVGDSSENPFQGLMNDIPMLSLCRTIEIDLREMLNEKALPEPIKEINGVLN